jgi:hypothetical protein
VVKIKLKQSLHIIKPKKHTNKGFWFYFKIKQPLFINNTTHFIFNSTEQPSTVLFLDAICLFLTTPHRTEQETRPIEMLNNKFTNKKKHLNAPKHT